MNEQLKMNLEKFNGQWLIPFKANENDYKRWNGQAKAIFDVLSDGGWHTRDELVYASRAKQPTARISELRTDGYIIECNRAGQDGSTMYQIKAYVGYDTTEKKHCSCCRYNNHHVESYTG